MSRKLLFIRSTRPPPFDKIRCSIMAVKKDYNALIAELKKNIDKVEINLEKARQAETKTAEKQVEVALKAFERSNKKLTTLKQKAPVVSAKKTPAQVARLQKWKTSVAEQRQTTSLLKIDLNSAKSALADLKKREKERQTIEKERAAAIKSTLETRKTKKTPKKNSPKPKTIQSKLVATKAATKPTEKKPVKRKATSAKTTASTKKIAVAPSAKITPKAPSIPTPKAPSIPTPKAPSIPTPKITSIPTPERLETPIAQKEKNQETTHTPIQVDLIGMNPEFVSIAKPETPLKETFPEKIDGTESTEKESTEKESTAE